MEIRYEISQSIIARKVAGELLLVPVKDNLGDFSVMYTANETGTRIWELLFQKVSLSKITQTVLEEYEINELNFKEDLKNFMEQLVSIGVLIQK